MLCQKGNMNAKYKTSIYSDGRQKWGRGREVFLISVCFLQIIRLDWLTDNK